MFQPSILRAGPDFVPGLAQLYPETTGRLSHALCDHPLLAFSALIDAALRLPADRVELRSSDGPPGSPFVFARQGRRDAAALASAIAGGSHWLMLRNPERLGDYAALMEQLVAAIAPVVADRTGPPLHPQMFLFVSSPGSHTPVHLDPEYNILFQIAGTKTFSVLPRSAADGDTHVRLHADGDNLLRWDDSLAALATGHRLDPGQAMYVPYKAPHFVDVGGDAVSISLSLTWKSRWSQDQEAAWRLKARLARRGLTLPTPPDWPRSAPLMSLAGRLLDRVAP